MSARLAAISVVSVICLAEALVYTQSMPPPPAPRSAMPSQAKVGPVAPPTTDADKIKSAMSAAPAAIASAAAIMDVAKDMTMKTLRAGTNGWTCIADGPSPGVDPMCVDQNGLLWMDAWMHRKDPPAGKLGLGYMLAGGSDASNTNPFATEPAPGGKWVDTGPHMMVFNIGDHFAGYPTTPGTTKAPWVMWPGTPYAHLMVPVK